MDIKTRESLRTIKVFDRAKNLAKKTSSGVARLNRAADESHSQDGNASAYADRKTEEAARRLGCDAASGVGRAAAFGKWKAGEAVRSGKAAEKAAQSAKKAAEAAKKAAEATAKTVKAVAEAAIEACKAVVKAVKSIAAVIAAGGWAAVVIIVVICLIGMVMAAIIGILKMEPELFDGTVG